LKGVTSLIDDSLHVPQELPIKLLMFIYIWTRVDHQAELKETLLPFPRFQRPE
jgi:hypothetical protein